MIQMVNGPAGFGTTTAEMSKASQHVLTVNESVKTELVTLRSKLEALRGLWSGDAYRAFVVLMARWDNDARSLNDALRSIGEAIQGSGVTYQQQEDQQTAGLSSITSALG